MFYLYGSKRPGEWELAGTFDTDSQLLAYVSWATLKINPDETRKFEQGSVLAGYSRFTYSETPLTDEDVANVLHSPTPNML